MRAPKKSSRLPAPSGFLNSFRVFKATPKRAKFGPERLEEVNAVRDRGACLRCRLLKIKCSQSDLCTTCAELVHGHEKQTMSFSGCIRTKLTDVSIFGKYAPKGDTQTLMMQKSKALALPYITLSFAAAVTWDLDVLVNDISVWLRDPTIPKTSKVGILSSPNFLDLIKSSGGKVVDPKFQLMMYATSLAYTQPTEPPLDTNDIYNIGCIAGHDFLNVLEEWLKPQSLQKCSHDDLRALFLMVFGTILSVGYCHPSSHQDGPADDQGHNTRDMQSHICQILAHYILYLGSRLHLPLESGIDQFIIEAASSRWHKQGIFDWRRVKKDEDLDELNLGLDFGSVTNESDLEDIHDIQLSGKYWEDIPRSWLYHVPEDHISSSSINANMSLDDLLPETLQGPQSQTVGAKVKQRRIDTGAMCGNIVERGFCKHPMLTSATAPAPKLTYGACQFYPKKPQPKWSVRHGRLVGQVAEHTRQIREFRSCDQCAVRGGVSCKSCMDGCVFVLPSSSSGCQMEFCAGFVPDDQGVQSKRPVKECLLV